MTALSWNSRAWVLPVPARDGLGLRLDPVHRLNELSSTVRRRVREDDQPQPITLPPEDILPIGSVRLDRIEQRAVERLLRNTSLQHLRLGMTAHSDVPEARHVFVKVSHATLWYPVAGPAVQSADQIEDEADRS